MDELLKNKLGLQVLTDTGWSDFAGLLVKGKKKTVEVKTSSRKIVCTPEHKFFKPNLEFIEARQLKPKSKILTSTGIDQVVSIKTSNESDVYDLFDVKNNHRFYANDILVKNCEFLIFEETLINTIKLSELKGIDPIMTMGQTRWYKDINPKCSYLVSLDPSLGTGGDYSAIQVFELPDMIQVGEWRHNLTPVQSQIKHLKDICKYIHDRGIEKSGEPPSIYYSTENNTLGEAALVVIKDIGEENFHGIFLSEPMRKGHIRRFRKGFNTTHRTKITACSKLKNMLETGRLVVNSKPLISELKNFVAHGVGYGAKTGEHDDLVSATLLAIRMAGLLAEWDPNIYDVMLERISEDEMPMPIFISSGF